MVIGTVGRRVVGMVVVKRRGESVPSARRLRRRGHGSIRWRHRCSSGAIARSVRVRSQRRLRHVISTQARGGVCRQ